MNTNPITLMEQTWNVLSMFHQNRRYMEIKTPVSVLLTVFLSWRVPDWHYSHKKRHCLSAMSSLGCFVNFSQKKTLPFSDVFFSRVPGGTRTTRCEFKEISEDYKLLNIRRLNGLTILETFPKNTKNHKMCLQCAYNFSN